MQAVYDDTQAKDYHLRGFKKLLRQPDLKHFLVVASMCSYPADCILMEFLEEYRVPLHLNEYTRVLDAEMQGLQALPGVVWDELASWHSDVSGPGLRAEFVACGHVSLGFIDTQVWSRTREWQWKLVIGDIAGNLDALGALVQPPDESLSRKVWALLRQGFPRAQLVAGVSLLRHIVWISATVEQQHASATLVHRQHPGYGLPMICCRAIVHTSRMLFGTPPSEVVEEKLAAKAHELLARRPSCFGTRQLYTKKVLDRAVSRGLAAGAPVGHLRGGKPAAQRHFQKAQSTYNILPPELRTYLKEEANVESQQKIQAHDAEISAAIAGLEKERLRKKTSAERELPPKLVFSTCIYSPAQHAALNRTFNADTLWGRAHVGGLREVAMKVPRPLAVNLAKQMDDEQLLIAPEKQRPWWLIHLCVCRMAFKDKALRIGTGDEVRYFKFLFAKQRLLAAAFIPLQLQWPQYTEAIDYDLYEALGYVDFPQPESWQYRFVYNPMEVVQTNDIDVDANSAVAVLPDLLDLQRHNGMVSDGPAIWFGDFVAQLPLLAKARTSNGAAGGGKASSSGHRQTAADAYLVAHPWMAKPHPEKKRKVDFAREDDADSAAESDEGEIEDCEGGEVSCSDDEAIVVDDVFRELQSARDRWHEEHGHQGQDDFGGGLLGGFFIRSASGHVADNVCCEATTAAAREFVVRYGLHASKRANIILYGMDTASCLCLAWAHKMQYYLDLYLGAGVRNYAFTSDDHNAYREPPDFSELAKTERNMY